MNHPSFARGRGLRAWLGALREAAYGSRPLRRSLFRKYTIAFATLVCGALVASGVAQAFFSYHETRQVLADLQREKVTVAAQAIDHFIGEIERQLKWATPAARPSGAAGLDERREDYYRLMRQFPGASEVRYIDAMGLEQLHVSRLGLDRLRSGLDYSRTPEFIGASESGPYFGSVYFVGDTEPYMNVSLGEASGDGGATLVEVNLKFIGDVVCCTRVGRSGAVYVVGPNGRLIAHPDLSLVLRQTNLAAPPEPLLPHVRAALQRPPGVRESRELVLGEDADGQPIVASYAMIDRTAWLVFVEQPLVEALQPLTTLLLRTAALLLFGLVVSVLVSLALARRMVTPIEAVQAGAARIDAGALEQQIHVRTGDELEALADEFNRMAARLKNSYTGLEERVDERTRNLAAALQVLRDRSRQLEEASFHRTESLAYLSHELRSPLTSIIGYAELIGHDRSGERARRREYVDNILSAGQHLLSLINEALDLARAQAGKIHLGIASFDVRTMLESSITMLRESADRRGVALSLAVEDGLAPLEADERKIKQIVLNLLSNAIKFTPSGGHVEVRAAQTETGVDISVKDTGVGMAPHELERIFEPYERLAEGSSDGAGLGLALSKHLAELHGGRIEVQSQEGVGSTFTLALPLHPAAPVLPAVGADRPARTPMDPRRAVLLVEGDQPDAERLGRYIADAGFLVTRAASGPEGIDLARRVQPAAIVLDIDLPNLDGWGFLARARTEALLAGIPVIVVSVLHEHQRALDLGATDYVLKPVGRDTLLAAVRRHVVAELLQREDQDREPGDGSVLVIEDDADVAGLIEAVLQPEGYTVRRVESGSEGLALARSERPGLVIVDLLVPDTDGFAVVHGLRADRRTATVPIVVLTGKTLTRAERQWLERHIDHLAEKGSFTAAELAGVVSRLLPPPSARLGAQPG